MSTEVTTLDVPAACGLPALSIDVGRTREAESRLIEAKNVSPSTYTDLEHCFQEGYRELSRGHTSVSWQLERLDIEIGKLKGRLLCDEYFNFMKDRPKGMDSGDMREGFLMRNDAYVAMLDRKAQLRALQSMIDRKIKVLENVVRYSRKKMDMLIRSGMAGADLYLSKPR